MTTPDMTFLPPPGAKRTRKPRAVAERPSVAKAAPADAAIEAGIGRRRRVMAALAELHGRVGRVQRPSVEIRIDGPINAATAKRVQSTLLEHPRSRINVVINSRGGEVKAGLAIYRALRGHRAPTRAVALTKCASAATLVLVACEERAARDDTTFCVHDVAADLEGDPAERWTSRKLEATARSVAETTALTLAIISRRTSTPVGLLGELSRADRTMNAREAKHRRLIQTIVGEHGRRPAWAWRA